MRSVPCLLSSDEDHSAPRQLFIVCHQYRLGNDLFWVVAMVTVICMEMMLVLVEGEKAADTGREIKRCVQKRRGRGEKRTCVMKKRCVENC